MTTGSGSFPELLWPGISDLWGDTYYDSYEPLYEKIFEMRKSNMRFEKMQNVTGLGLASVKDEGSPIGYEDPFEGPQEEFVNTTYAQGAIITREMVEDDMYQFIDEIPGMLAESLRQTEETIAFNHLNRAFNSSYTGADGVSLCNASHSLVGGGTYRNQLNTASDLSQTSLETATQDLMDFVNEMSLKIRVMPKCLVVPTALNHTALKLIESDLVIGSADNDPNTTKGLFQDLIVSPWLTDSDAWFIVTDIRHGLVWFDRRDAEIVRDNEFDTQNLKIANTKRFSSGWSDPRGVFGTAGAA
jgi:uncharacterized protein YbaR (Trm112 family)